MEPELSGLLAAVEFDARDMDQIYDLHRARIVRDTDGSPAGNDPDEVLVRNRKMPLVRQINREGFERGLLPSFSDLLCRHALIIAERAPDV